MVLHLQKSLHDITLLDVYHAVEVVDEGELFQMHENPNPNCPVGANIQGVLELYYSVHKMRWKQF